MINSEKLAKLDKTAKLNIVLAISFFAITIASNVVSHIKSAPVGVMTASSTAVTAPSPVNSKRKVAVKNKKKRSPSSVQAVKSSSKKTVKLDKNLNKY